MKVQSSNYEIVHRNANRNQNTDFLSRLTYDQGVRTEYQDSPAPEVTVIRTQTKQSANGQTTLYQEYDRTQTETIENLNVHLEVDDPITDPMHGGYIEVTLNYATITAVASIDQEVPDPKPIMADLQMICLDFTNIYKKIKNRPALIMRDSQNLSLLKLTNMLLKTQFCIMSSNQESVTTQVITSPIDFATSPAKGQKARAS